MQASRRRADGRLDDVRAYRDGKFELYSRVNVGVAVAAKDTLKVTKGTPKVYESSEHGRRQFCANCGSGLFYTNANVLPGIVDIQSATYDDPDAVPAMVHIQTAERIRWMERAHELPTFERYPPQA